MDDLTLSNRAFFLERPADASNLGLTGIPDELKIPRMNTQPFVGGESGTSQQQQHKKGEETFHGN